MVGEVYARINFPFLFSFMLAMYRNVAMASGNLTSKALRPANFPLTTALHERDIMRALELRRWHVEKIGHNSRAVYEAPFH